MEYAWLKSCEVTKEFLDARLDPTGRLGTMITPDMEEEAIAKSNNCHSSRTSPVKVAQRPDNQTAIWDLCDGLSVVPKGTPASLAAKN
ncbi:uncharacterized protein N7506_005021 [Penicillium brevicompactum]|uniref:uncharacterized protein n=1 Tax=Penicillium brevicompactum TaxID=5074 RepID=UPI002540D905|nr:uncharacterized protein N7506_005021 [Penicillium brevicompactum]KAJ5336999.1 hypothetical protein N7506_005021 [Penicillium brevicompactum]